MKMVGVTATDVGDGVRPWQMICCSDDIDDDICNSTAEYHLHWKKTQQVRNKNRGRGLKLSSSLDTRAKHSFKNKKIKSFLFFFIHSVIFVCSCLLLKICKFLSWKLHFGHGFLLLGQPDEGLCFRADTLNEARDFLACFKSFKLVAKT